MVIQTTMLAVLDVAHCKVSAAEWQWAKLSRQIFGVLTTPTLILPLIWSVIILPWLIRPLRQKWQVSGMGVGLLLLYLLIGSNPGIAIGNRVLTSFLPPDAGRPADAIVILGRGPQLRQERVEVAAKLWQAGRAPLVFASGRGDARSMVQLLQAAGLPPDAIAGEVCSRSTEENAIYTAAMLQPRNVQQIVLVTDLPHMLRSLLTFRSLGFEVMPHPNPLAQVSSQKQGFILFREYLGLMSYSLLGRFLPRSAPSIDKLIDSEAVETATVEKAAPSID